MGDESICETVDVEDIYEVDERGHMIEKKILDAAVVSPADAFKYGDNFVHEEFKQRDEMRGYFQ